MNVSTFIAKRYLFAKKSRNIINLISFISFFGLFVSAASLIIILSGFNGIQKYVEDMYGKHAADLYIKPIKGKTITNNHPIFQKIDSLKIIKYYSKVIEETALLKFEDRWVSARIKGIDSYVFQNEDWGNSIINGSSELFFRGLPTIVIGYGIQYQLQAPVDLNFLNEIKIYSLPRKKKISIQNNNAFNSRKLILAGVFNVNPDLDQTTALVDYSTANEIFEMNSNANYIEIFLEKPSEILSVKKKLEVYNKDLKISSHEDSNQLIYAANDAEKWMVLAVLIFILMLSSFTIIASITMLIIDKKKDIKTLVSIGCNYNTIRNIFFKEGLFISLLGSVSGLFIGLLVCWLQINFQLVKLENAAIDYWPVLIKIQDLLMLLFILFVCGLIAAYLPSKILMNRLIKS